MYTNHFGLRLAPFEDRADPQFALMTPELEETLAALEYEIQYDKGMALVTGDAGLGKTQLVRTLLTRLPARDHAVLLTRSCHRDTDLLLETARGFGVSTSEDRQDRVITRLRNRLSQHAKSEHRCVLVIDQAENLSIDDLHQLATLHDLTANTVRLLAVVLCGQPRTLELLQDRDLERLDQKLFSRQSLRPLTAEQTRAYIEHRLRVAGASDGTIVAEDAHELIHQVARGVPRVINNICHAAMLAAYGADASTVTADIVREVLEGVMIKERTADAACLGRPVELRAAESTQPISTPPDRGEYDSLHEYTDDHVSRGDRPEYGSYEGADWPPSAEAYGDMHTAEALEQKLAQAERICAATDAKLAQMCAVERHLETLVRAAQRLTPTLRQSVAHHGQSVDQLQERICSSLADAERRVGEIDARSTRALEVSKNLSGHLIRAESECDRAEAVSTRLSVFADQLAHSVDDMQARTAPLVDTLQSAEELRDRLEAACQRANEIGQGLSTRIEREQKSCAERTRRILEELAESAGATTDAAKQEIAATLREATTAAEEKMRETLTSLEKETSETTGALEQRARATVDALEQKTHALDQKADALGQKTSEMTRALEQRMADATSAMEDRVLAMSGALEEKLRATATEAEESAAEVLAMVSREITEAQERARSVETQIGALTEHAEDRRQSLESSVESLIERVGNASLQLGHLSETSRSVQSSAEDLVKRVREARDSIGPAVEQSAQVTEQVRTARGNLDRLQVAVADRLVDIGRAAEQLEGLRNEAESCNALANDLLQRRDMIKQTLEALQERERLSDECARRVEAMDARLEATRETVAMAEKSGDDLNAIVMLAERRFGDVKQHSVDLQRQLESAAANIDELSNRTKEGEKAAEKLAGLNATAGELHDALQGVVAHADDKSDRIEAHVVNADRVLRDLNSVNEAARKTVEQATERTEDFAATAERERTSLSSMLDRARDLTTSVVDERQQLATEAASAQELLASLQEHTGPARDVAETLTEKLSDATQLAEEMTALRDSAAQFNTNLANAKPLAELVQQSDEAARRAVVELGQVRDEVIAVLEDAGHNLALLERVNESATATVEMHRGFTERMESLSAQFEDRVVDTKTAIATGEQLLTEFIAQGDSINEQLSALSQRSEALDRRIDALLTKPEGVVATAREQAEHLERVCLVGRRILANVSSATLAARDHAEALRRAGEHSDEQFATLTKQTRQAAMTLREWVDEAIHAQQRLERTIGVCPGIKETHSRASLEGLGQLAAAQAKTSHRLEGRLGSLEEPVAAKAPSQPGGTNGEAASQRADSTVSGRSRDVAKLIEDAQRSRAQRAKA